MNNIVFSPLARFKQHLPITNTAFTNGVVYGVIYLNLPRLNYKVNIKPSQGFCPKVNFGFFIFKKMAVEERSKNHRLLTRD